MGSVLGTADVGVGGEWAAVADLSGLQGEVTITALALDEGGMVRAQSAGLTITVAPQLAPPTGAEFPDDPGPPGARVGLALTIILGLTLVTGGLVLRQAGRLLSLREEDER